MARAGVLSAADLGQALADAIVLSPPAAYRPAPHFVEMVLAGAGDARAERIVTTLDAGLQADIAGVIESQRDLLRRHGAQNVAVVVLDNARGEWLAWEGSGDYFGERFGGAIDGVTTPRQPGSALKPFTYALAF